jgi:hypothetical protein
VAYTVRSYRIVQFQHGTLLRHFHGLADQFSVALADSFGSFHRDLDFVPVARLELLELAENAG